MVHLMNRIVTGLGAAGRATIVHADQPSSIGAMAGGENETRICWASSGPVTLPYDGVDLTVGGVPAFPGPGETRFLVLTVAANFRSPMHVTQTTDYVVILAGELWLIMEDGREVKLSAGDTVIQHGTLHAWENRSAEPCIVAATMIAVGGNQTASDDSTEASS